MSVELLVVRDCAHAESAGILLAHALAAEGLDPHFEVVLVDTPEQAQARDFLGSPSFAVDGKDLFASRNGVPGVACRVSRLLRGVLQKLRARLEPLDETRDENDPLLGGRGLGSP